MPSCMVKCSVKTVPLINHCMVLHFHLAGPHSPNIYCKQKEDPRGGGGGGGEKDNYQATRLRIKP